MHAGRVNLAHSVRSTCRARRSRWDSTKQELSDFLIGLFAAIGVVATLDFVLTCLGWVQ